jgi:hypothetical protein
MNIHDTFKSWGNLIQNTYVKIIEYFKPSSGGFHEIVDT